jgi:hypothetical protein
MKQIVRLGRKPRIYRPEVPHMSALLAGRTLPPIPDSIDYTVGMGGDYSVMMNDMLSCCTASAFFHARLVFQRPGEGNH